MTSGPIGLTLRAELNADGLAAGLQTVVAHLGAAGGIAAPLAWRAGETVAPLDTPPPPAAAHLALEFDAPETLVQLEPGDVAGRVRLQIDDGPEAARVLPAMRAILAAMADAGDLRSATVERLAGGHCLPWLPLVGDAVHIVACAADDIARDYSENRAFLRMWDEAEVHGALHLLSRAMDSTDNPDFLRAVLFGQTAMARLARPGSVRIYPPRFQPGEFEVLDAGDPTLIGVGYHAADQVYEYAGHTPSGTELRWVDVLAAWRIVQDGALEDGSPVREVRAVFMDKDQATRARALLDVAGVRSYWENSAGELQPS